MGSDCFPFVYPPLWAWLAAKLVPLLDDRVWLALPFVANPLLAVGCTWCTWRATGATMNPDTVRAIGGTRFQPFSRGGAALYMRVWPVSLLLIAVTAPLAWSCYLLAGLFFLPLLFQDVRTGAIASVLWFVISPFGVVIRLWGAARAQQIAVALAALGFAFLFARRPQR